MWKAKVVVTDNDGREFGYGQYVNAIVFTDYAPGGEIVKSKRLPFDAPMNQVEATKRRMLGIAKSEAEARNQ